MKDNIGDRLKNYYENRSKTFLTRKIPVIIRVDGKCFHNFCKRFKKPYDEFLNNSLNKVMQFLCQNIQGAKMAERHSDEISILLTDYDNVNTDCWFDYNVQKTCSIAASIATSEFCKILAFESFKSKYDGDKKNISWEESWPIFDARCFNLPEHEINNYFYWRMLDAKRNSISMVAQANFSHKSLQGLNSNQMQEKLWQEKQINWAKLPQGQKIGFICIKEKILKSISEGQNTGEMVERHNWIIKESPSSKTELDNQIKLIKFFENNDSDVL